MQKIVIKNIGPIKEFEMEVNKYNILIGEQATGKSTVAKSVYFFHTVKTTILNYLWQICDRNGYQNIPYGNKRFDQVIKKELKDIFVKLFGYSWDLDKKLLMEYWYTDDIWIKVDLSEENEEGKRFIGVTYSTELMGKIRELECQARDLFLNSSHLSISLALSGEERNRNHTFILENINKIFQDDTEAYYIPAGRSLLTVMAGNRAVMSGLPNLDLITDRFLALIDTIRENFSEGIAKAHRYYPSQERSFDVGKVSSRITEILKGEYFYSKGREILKIKDCSQSVKMNFMSSGQQEVLWLLNFLYVLLLRNEKSFVVIEEPEAHIYPEQQKKLMEFIIFFANLSCSKVFITTHSPYLLTVANNYFYAGNLKARGMENAVGQVVTKEEVIEDGSLSAYKLFAADQKHEEGYYKNLLDERSMEIRADMIDEVSDAVNELYTTLYGIELDQE